MLIQFSIENHRSIKDSAVISFAASKDKSLESYLLHPDEKRALLPAIAIYGANAAGKSNVLHALMTMKDMVVGEAAKISKGQKLPWEPFGGTTTPTSFEIVFIYHGIRYAYGYSFDAKKIYTEYLYHWPNGREALIFSRENGVYEFAQIVSGNEKKARILKELLLADLGISDVTIKNISGKAPVITTTHRVIGADGSVEHFQLLMDQESSGTQRFFSRIGGWLQALEDGALLVVDEIEDSLHPLLTKRLIEMVQDNTINTEGAQLLFTTHDAMLLDLTFFRRDQIWFAEKDERSCATELYSLASFSPRKGENIRKGYLQGRFGAIPFIGGDGLWQE